MSAAPQAIAGTDLFALFPSPLWEVHLAAASRDAVGAAVDAVIAQRRDAAHAPGTGAAWTFEGGLHREEALAPLLRLFVQQGTEALDFLRVPHDSLEVVSCTAEVGPGGQDRPFQAPANAYLAGVYVARAPQACRVEFEDPRGQAHLIAPPRTTAEVPDSPVASMAADAGTLLVYPAWLRHRVVSPPGEGEYVALTLALLFGRFAETIARPKWKGHKQ